MEGSPPPSSPLNQYKGVICALMHPTEVYAPIDSDFANTFMHELGLNWILIDPKQQVHIVRFQVAGNVPLITHGWYGLRQYYGLRGLNWCLLKYIGQSTFEISIYEDPMREISYEMCPNPLFNYPHYLMVLSSAMYHCCFTFAISESMSKGYRMNLPRDVGRYVVRRGVDTWKLRGPSGIVVDCHINGDLDSKIVTMGSGWRKFCDLQFVRAGHVLTFFVSRDPDTIIDVSINYQFI